VNDSDIRSDLLTPSVVGTRYADISIYHSANLGSSLRWVGYYKRPFFKIPRVFHLFGLSLSQEFQSTSIKTNKGSSYIFGNFRKFDTDLYISILRKRSYNSYAKLLISQKIIIVFPDLKRACTISEIIII
jgi:hypothetical protein